MPGNAEQCINLKAQEFKKTDAAKKLFDQHLSDNVGDIMNQIGFDNPTLDKFTKSLNQYYTCDNECLEKKRKQNLRDTWNQSNLDAELSEVRSIISARNYFGVTTDKWIDWRNKQVNTDWLELHSDISKSAISVNNTFNVMDRTYQDELSMLKQVQNLIDIKNKEFVDIIKNIMEYEKIVNVDVRKNYYQFSEQQFYNNIKFYLKIIYYVLFAIYIFFGDFMAKTRYKDYRFYVVAVIYLLLPFVIKYIIGFMAYIYNWVLEYLNLKPPVYAYSDIIRANNIDKIYTSPVPSATQMENQKNPNMYNHLTDFVPPSMYKTPVGSSSTPTSVYSALTDISIIPMCNYVEASNNISVFCSSGNLSTLNAVYQDIPSATTQEKIDEYVRGCQYVVANYNFATCPDAPPPQPT
jgi:hypothetical protein